MKQGDLMTHTRLLTPLVLVGALAVTANANSSDNRVGFAERSFTDGSSSYRYRVFVPAKWTGKKKWPVILFLHGAGERGDDNLAQTRVGIGPALERLKDTLQAVVVLPQCPRGRWWSEPEMQVLALKALEKSMTEFNADGSRVYLTGLSMGGYGSWALAVNNPMRFAAISVICGGIRAPGRAGQLPNPLDVGGDPYRSAAEKIGKRPIWIFHGGADPVVPVTESRKMVEAFKSLGVIVRFSEYEGVSHNSWDKAYAEPEIFPWMLAQKLKAAKR
ncbi:MAG TPA: PHB depolymerase family esterase [Blastocatellia bacterium]|nr:PHB depolymerase family esterase [Blastocatellia bacterium]